MSELRRLLLDERDDDDGPAGVEQSDVDQAVVAAGIRSGLCRDRQIEMAGEAADLRLRQAADAIDTDHLRLHIGGRLGRDLVVGLFRVGLGLLGDHRDQLIGIVATSAHRRDQLRRHRGDRQMRAELRGEGQRIILCRLRRARFQNEQHILDRHFRLRVLSSRGSFASVS